jgi:hypothetical protein
MPSISVTKNRRKTYLKKTPYDWQNNNRWPNEGLHAPNMGRTNDMFRLLPIKKIREQTVADVLPLPLLGHYCSQARQLGWLATQVESTRQDFRKEVRISLRSEF